MAWDEAVRGKILAYAATFLLAATLLVTILDTAWPEVVISGLLLLANLAIGPAQARIMARRERKRLGRGKRG